MPEDEKPTARRRTRAPRKVTAEPPVPVGSRAPRRRGNLPSHPIEELPDFGSLYFGRAAAEAEVADNPGLFRTTYLDRQDLPALVSCHERFLVLGPKGTGKSASAAFVVESWKHELGGSAVFAMTVDFDEMNRTQTPLSSLDSQLVSPKLTAMTDAAWKLFIGVRLLESLIADPASDLSSDPHAARLLADLKSAGLASDDYPRVLRSVRDRRSGFNLKYIFAEFSAKEGDSLSPGQVGDALLKLVSSCSTPNRHLLAIDGLDKAITDNEAYWQTVAALIRVADLVRRLGQKGSGAIFVMLMCRSDVFRRIRFADAPKIAADGGVHIGWQAEAAEPRDVLLWDYLAKKSGLTKEQVWAYLPSSVRVGKQGGVPTLRYLLDFTRYTPRDMSLLFKFLQSEWTGGALKGEQVRAAADHFASQHLLSEIVAEAIGLLPTEVIDRLEVILGSFPKRVITKAQLRIIIADQDLADTISESQLGEYLFLQGAIGNYKPDVGYVQFFHRRDAAKFQTSGPWVLHTGLVYAMNVPWSGI